MPGSQQQLHSNTEPGKENIHHRKVFFMVPVVPGINPGQRFRFEHYLPLMEKAGLKYKIGPFYSMSAWRILYSNKHKIKKAWIVAKGFIKRSLDLFRVLPYDFIYIYREATPLGPPVFEWILAKILRKKIIYDFDDAIWIPATTDNNKRIIKLKWFPKVSAICRWSFKVSVGNQFLADFALRHNKNVVLIPTVVDTENNHNSLHTQKSGKVTIGWTGTFSTLKYLQIVLPILQRLEKKFEFKFLVIADKDPQLPLKNYSFLPWQRQTEVDDLLLMDIGIMPLFDDSLSKGKCGFKAIQYLSLGIPAVISPVGVNSIIVDNGVNGYLCSSEEEWEARLSELLQNSALRGKFGLAGRRKIEEHYSVHATEELFMQLFDEGQPLSRPAGIEGTD